jgi:hypothetical protein
MPKYCFLNYSSTLDQENRYSYTYGFGKNFFRITGDRPFGRGDVIEMLSEEQCTLSEYRINVRVLGDPRVSGRRFDPSTRIELPTLIFLSTRIYLSEFSDYRVELVENCQVLTFQGTTQDRNKIYAVALLATGTEGKIICQEPTSKSRFEWILNATDDFAAVP